MGRALPAFMFYPKDWLGDPALRSVSVAARGLWADILCLTHQSPEYGVLAHLDGRAWTDHEISRATGVPTRTVIRLREELKAAGVFDLNDRLAITSRRQKLDHERRLNDQKRQQSCRSASNKSARLPKPVTVSSHASSYSSSSSREDLTMERSGSEPVTPKSNGVTEPFKLTPPSAGAPTPQEVRPMVFLTLEDQRKLEDEFGTPEYLYWLNEVAGAAKRRPVWWRKYKDHADVMRSWRRRELSKGSTFDPSRNLYLLPQAQPRKSRTQEIQEANARLGEKIRAKGGDNDR